ncbi:MAG: 3-deoxy-8-phosphooctulonate synthase [Bacteroidia bacterium]
MNTAALLGSNPANQFFLLAGPCVVESEELCMQVAEHALNVCNSLQIPYVFKASYRKANRSSMHSFQGIGDEKALNILGKVKAAFNIPVVTDIHTAEEAAMAAAFVDVLQIPAFLCRQTDLLLAAAATGKWVNIKKGQFLSPGAMRFAVEKVRAGGNTNIMLTERGSMFGYNDMIVDFRGIPEMQALDVPVVVDITHSLQQPNQSTGVTGGRPELIGTIAKAAIATGADGIFLETHPHPAKALSDGANMLHLNQFEGLMQQLTRIRQAVAG